MACQEMGALYHGKFIFSSGFSDSVHRGFMFSFSAAVSGSSSMYIFSFCVTFIPPCTAGGHLWYNGRNAAVLRRLPGCCAPLYHPPAHGPTARFSVGRVGKIGRRRNPSQRGTTPPLALPAVPARACGCAVGSSGRSARRRTPPLILPAVPFPKR